jgi:hypothetical protein
MGNGQKAQEAKKWDIPVVEPKWILDLAEATWPGQRLDRPPPQMIKMGDITNEPDRRGGSGYLIGCLCSQVDDLVFRTLAQMP